MLALPRLARGSSRESGRARSGVGVGSGVGVAVWGIGPERGARGLQDAASHLAGLRCEVGAVAARRAVDRGGECLQLIRLQPGRQHHHAVRLPRLMLRVSRRVWVRALGQNPTRPDPTPTQAQTRLPRHAPRISPRRAAPTRRRLRRRPGAPLARAAGRCPRAAAKARREAARRARGRTR